MIHLLSRFGASRKRLLARKGKRSSRQARRPLRRHLLHHHHPALPQTLHAGHNIPRLRTVGPGFPGAAGIAAAVDRLTQAPLCFRGRAAAVWGWGLHWVMFGLAKFGSKPPESPSVFLNTSPVIACCREHRNQNGVVPCEKTATGKGVHG